LPDADETVKEYLNIIMGEINNSERIISDLIDFTHTKMPQTKSVTVKELISQSLGKCFIPDSVAVQVTIPATLPTLRVDPLQMGQILQNLIVNAIQAMPEGGSLTIEAKEDVEENSVKICVTDTGVGISTENMRKLFHPLFTTRARGIGLGLSVSRNLAEANGGRIEVESQLETGTTFSVILPSCERG
jgi:signal transduction histidine kinase